ncbi:MAG: VWA domain-containing protein, partial [Campylobacterota bacterium]|nr:VWA domain-containing protein [Campylobacterota bacterium]
NGVYFEFPKIVSVFFIFLACEALCKMKLPSLYFPHTAQFMKTSMSSSSLIIFLKWLGISMLVVALMSPVKDESTSVEPKRGLDIALILDTSESMQQRGFDRANPTLDRFDVVKKIVKEFIAERKNDNIALVVFGEYAFIASPLTYDLKILDKVVDRLQIGIAGRYTALYDSLAQGVNVLKDSKAKSKIAILLTDGHNTAPQTKVPLNAAIDMAKKADIKVYTIGIGERREYNGALLKHIASQTGAEAFGAIDATKLEAIYNRIDELEKSEIESNDFTYKSYFYHYPLFIAILALIGFIYLRNKRGF